MGIKYLRPSIPGQNIAFDQDRPAPLLFGVGDSRIAQGWSTITTEWAPMARNILWWAEILSRRVRINPRYDQAVSGITAQGLYSRIAGNTVNDWGFAAKDTPQGAIGVLLVLTNDVTVTSQTIAGLKTAISYYDKIVEYYVSRGHRMILIADLPRDGTNLTAAQIDFLCYVSETIRRYRNSEWVEVVDVWPDVADPASTNCSPRTGIMQTDGLHLSNGCAYAIGRRIAEILDKWGLPILPDGCGSNADSYDVTNNPYGCINGNPMVTGTAGTVGTGASGVSPDSHGLSAGTGLAVVGSQTSTVQNGVLRDCFKMIITGVGGVGRQIQLDRNLSTASFLLGDRIQAGFEFKISAGHTNLESPYTRFQNGANTLPSGFIGVYDVASTPMNAVLTGEPIRGVAVTRPVIIESIPASATLRSGVIVGNTSISVSIELRIFAHWLRKV